MKTKKASMLFWILLVLIILVIGLVIFILFFSESIDIKNIFNPSNSFDNQNRNSEIINNSNSDSFDGDSSGVGNSDAGSDIPAPPALPLD